MPRRIRLPRPCSACDTIIECPGPVRQGVPDLCGECAAGVKPVEQPRKRRRVRANLGRAIDATDDTPVVLVQLTERVRGRRRTITAAFDVKDAREFADAILELADDAEDESEE